MTEYGGKGPSACWDAIDGVVKSAQISGIVGDSAHTYGYHRGRNYCTDSGDYSCQQADDQTGPGEAASALDVTMNDADMKTVSKRLNDAVNKDDSRLHCLREWYGTTDGYNVTGRDVRSGSYISSDDSHLWHVHLSFYRKWADDAAECKKVAAVFTGGGTATEGDDEDMPKQIYLYSKSGQTTKLATSGKWYCVGWDAALANTGGSSLTLPKGTSIFSMSAWLYSTGMGKDDNLYWRIQTLDPDTGKEIAKFPIGEIRGTSGETDLAFSQVGSVAASKATNLRILVASTKDNVVINSAWWRCLYW